MNKHYTSAAGVISVADSCESAMTILIVDDDPLGREMLAALLLAQGYRLAFAANGTEALRQAAALQPDLILLDVMMPDMDGFEVCKRLRADPTLGEVLVIMLTALDDRESRLFAIEAGADDFISKPFDRTELRARVQMIARLNRYRRLLAERAKLDRVIEFAPDSILIVNEACLITLANPAATALLGVPLGHSLLGYPFVAFVTPEQNAECSACLEAILSGATSSGRIETVFVRPNGMRIPVELHIGSLIWDDHPAAQITARDITDRKRAELLEEERHHVAYDLHDGLAQLVVSVHQHLQSYAAHHRPRTPHARAERNHVLELARRSVKEVRQVIAGLRPTALDDFGLATALNMHIESLCADGWEFTFEQNLGTERLPTAVETVIYRIFLEALTNVRKHAATRRAHVKVERCADILRLVVQDWGRGFDPAAQHGRADLGTRIGLHSMRERVALLGGRWQIQSSHGHGTTIVAEIPLLYHTEKDNTEKDNHHETEPVITQRP